MFFVIKLKAKPFESTGQTSGLPIVQIIMTPDAFIKIISVPSSRDELRASVYPGFGDMLKGVVDVNRGIMAVGGELHADEEAMLLENGSEQKDLWGINLYLDKQMPELVEFDSMINIRPSQNNTSRSVEAEDIREKIITIVNKLIV